MTKIDPGTTFQVAAVYGWVEEFQGSVMDLGNCLLPIDTEVQKREGKTRTRNNVISSFLKALILNAMSL